MSATVQNIARNTGARLVSTFDLGKAIAQYGGYPEKQMGFEHHGQLRWRTFLLDGEVNIAFIPAFTVLP